jgi:hypothetical protein
MLLGLHSLVMLEEVATVAILEHNEWGFPLYNNSCEHEQYTTLVP